MSGVFVIVWNDKDKDTSPVLRTTVGGYPHVTVLYTGQHATVKALFAAARPVMERIIGETWTIVGAHVNAWRNDAGVIRYDVLMTFGQQTERAILSMRAELAAALSYAAPASNPPHVTHGAFSTPEDAERALQTVKMYLPYKVQVTGFTVD